jgi:hypothetical protein
MNRSLSPLDMQRGSHSFQEELQQVRDSEAAVLPSQLRTSDPRCLPSQMGTLAIADRWLKGVLFLRPRLS